jgi:hypothetical protein
MPGFGRTYGEPKLKDNAAYFVDVLAKGADGARR